MSKLICLAEFTFGWNGNAVANLLEGWSSPEKDFTWTTGLFSQLWLPPLPHGDGLTFLELQCAPFTAEARLEVQRLAIVFNGVVIAEEQLRTGGFVCFRVPEQVRSDGCYITVELRHPDAARPSELGVNSDTRRLGFAVSALRVLRLPLQPPGAITVLPPLALPLKDDRIGEAIKLTSGLEPEVLAFRFESLGHNCEFGILQRRLNAEPMSLLRFAGLSMESLITGLEDGFARAGDIVQICTVQPNQSGAAAEYMIHDEIYDIGLHTFQAIDAAKAEQIRLQHSRRMGFLRDHFRTHLLDGDRIFVFQHPGPIMACQALALLLRIRGFGPGALLFVDQSLHLPAGAVEQLGWGFFHGSLERMAPASNAGDLDFRMWLSLCINAHKLWTLSGGN